MTATHKQSKTHSIPNKVGGICEYSWSIVPLSLFLLSAPEPVVVRVLEGVGSQYSPHNGIQFFWVSWFCLKLFQKCCHIKTWLKLSRPVKSGLATKMTGALVLSECQNQIISSRIKECRVLFLWFGFFCYLKSQATLVAHKLALVSTENVILNNKEKLSHRKFVNVDINGDKRNKVQN